MVQSTLADRFKEIRQPNCLDYGARLQALCEVIWQSFENDPNTASPYVDDFVDLLKQGDNLSVARLVIPDLRSNSIVNNALKRNVLSRVQPPCQYPHPPAVSDDIKEAHRLYTQETAILQEVDMYRAGILLYNRGNLSDAEKRAVDSWLSDAPPR
jgi:hypothetical protein